MNDIKSVKKEIEHIIGVLVSTCMSSNQNYPIIRNSGSQQKLEWGEITNLSIALKNFDYSIVYTEIDKNCDYTLKLIDGNIIQMMYTFENGELISHRLAMFPSPKLEVFQNQPDIYQNDEIYADIIERKIVPFPIRFDYDKNVVASSHLHPHSHVTLGQYKHCRIPAYGPISPSVFMEFVLENFYNTYFLESYVSIKKKKYCNNFSTIKEYEKQKLHFNLL